MFRRSVARLYELLFADVASDIYPQQSSTSGIAATLLVPAILLLMIAVALVAARWFRRGSVAQGEGDSSLRLRDSLALGAQQRLLSVEWEGTRLLLSQTSEGIELLTSDLVRSRAEDLQRSQATTSMLGDEADVETPSFADMLRDDTRLDPRRKENKAQTPPELGAESSGAGHPNAEPPATKHRGTDSKMDNVGTADQQPDLEEWHV